MTGRLDQIDRIVMTCRDAFPVSVPMCRRADVGAVVGLERCQTPIAGQKRCRAPIVGHQGRVERWLQESL
jgi:hypothetical protein